MDCTQYKRKLVGSEDERAVSPVIGVILMVAVTVILAAVIATFVLDFGDEFNETAPNAQYSWDSNETNGLVNVTHTSGDTIDLETVTISATVDGDTESIELDDGAFTAGDTIRFSIDAGEDKVGIEKPGSSEDIEDYDEFDGDDGIEEIVITWEADDTSAVIADHEP